MNNFDIFRSVGDKNSSQKSDLVKITLEGCENENSKEKDSKDTKGKFKNVLEKEKNRYELKINSRKLKVAFMSNVKNAYYDLYARLYHPFFLSIAKKEVTNLF